MAVGVELAVPECQREFTMLFMYWSWWYFGVTPSSEKHEVLGIFLCLGIYCDWESFFVVLWDHMVGIKIESPAAKQSFELFS